MQKLRNRKGGFTLIELMIVVAIIGILAAIAIPNFLRFQLRAKTSEGKTNLAAIRTAEESYYSEYGDYISAQASPPAILFNKKVDFSHAIAGKGFDIIGWSPEGAVYFMYGVGIAGAPSAGSEFWATANADIDANGTFQAWSYRKGANVTNAITGMSLACAAVVAEQVAACDSTFGQSVF